jgi:LEA14-like dessication related protein
MRNRIAIFNTLAAILIFAACKTVEPVIKAEMAGPQLPEEDLQILTQSLTDCSIRYSAKVSSAEVQVTLEKAQYEFVVDGNVVRTAEKKLGVIVGAGEANAFSIEENLTYVKDEAELKAMDARGGSLLVAIRGKILATMFNVATQESKQIEFEFSKSKEIRTPRLPHLKMIEFDAGRFSDTEVQAVFHVGVVNPNPFVISISGLEWELSLAGKKVNSGTIGAGEKVSPSSTGVFDLTGTLSDTTHGKEAAKIVKSLVVPYALKSSMKAALYSEELSSSGDIKLTAAR